MKKENNKFKKRLLLFDINYTKSVNRAPILLKLRNWQKSNLTVTICTNKEGEKFYRANTKNLSYIVIPFHYKIHSYYDIPFQYLMSNFITLTHLKKLINAYDVVYSQSGWIDFLIIPFLLKLLDRNIQWYVMVDNLVPPPSKRPGPFLQKFIPYVTFLFGNLLLRKSDGIFVVTQSLKEYYEKKGMRVVKIGNGYGVDTSYFTKKINQTTPRFNAVYCGRFHPAKGIFDLITVVHTITQRNKTFTLGIMGDGDSKTKKQLVSLINKYHIQQNIELLGYKEGEEKIDILRSCEFFLFLSYDEGCPQAVIEAFAANKLVVAYDLPVYHDVFRIYIKNKEMKLFPIPDTTSIADFILKERYKQMSFKNDLQKFSWDAITDKEIAEFMR